LAQKGNAGVTTVLSNARHFELASEVFAKEVDGPLGPKSPPESNPTFRQQFGYDSDLAGALLLLGAFRFMLPGLRPRPKLLASSERCAE
jgi:hypothetical protein